MLKRLRVVLALFFWTGITLLFLDASGILHRYLGWMARVQFLPALLALNVAVIAGLVLLTLVFGRVYCSVLCPLGVFQDGISRLGIRGKKAPYRYRKEQKWLRYGIWALFFVALVAGVHAIVSLLAPYSAYGRMVQNFLQPLWLWGGNLIEAVAEKAGTYAIYPKEVWIRSVPVFVIALLTLIVVALLSFRGGRSYCNSLCPVGTTLSFFSRFALLRPVIDPDKCKHCKRCEQHCKARCISISPEEQKIDYSRCVDCFNCLGSCQFDALHYRFAYGRKKTAAVSESGRRAFMTGTAVAVGAAALKGLQAKAQNTKKVDGGFAELLPKQAPEREVPVTPPGSPSVRHFYQHCTACQLCVAECPNKVLRPSSDLSRLMQPELSFEKGWCRTDCTRCSDLCPTGAIRKIGPEEKTAYQVGAARVERTLCVAEKGTRCGKCAEVCPSGAILLVEGETAGTLVPSVTESLCIGCGACEFHCPSRPVSAITVNGKYQHV